MPGDRRDFLKRSAVGAAVAAWQGGANSACADRTDRSDRSLPPHRQLDLTGVHAYAQKSLSAGETVRFRVSSTVPYQLAVCRLAGPVDDPDTDEELTRFVCEQPRAQPIHPGSYVHVARGLPPQAAHQALTLECWVRPWRWNAWQGLVSQYDFPDACGVGLMLDDQGAVRCYFGDGGPFREALLFSGPELNRRRWNHLLASWNGERVTLWVNGKMVGGGPCTTPVRGGEAPLRLAAYGEQGVADHFLDGDLALPAIYGRPFTKQEVLARIAATEPESPQGAAALPDETIAFWPLNEEQGKRVADLSGQERHGVIINHATWMIGGPRFDGAAVERYDSSYDPAADPTRGHGLRFASDDLFDCRWEVTHEFALPPDAKSGVYVGRIRYEQEGKPCWYHVTFLVKRPPRRKRSPILMLCSTSTWLAYSGTWFPVPLEDGQRYGPGNLQPLPGTMKYSCYANHAAGQPTYYLGLRMPWPSAGPEVLYSPQQIGYSHLMRAELFAHHWLEENGYAYDVVADHDLHRDPEMLRGYQTVIINGHSEYWSAAALEGLDRYLKEGGTAIVMSGNTMFWRTSFNQDASVMECRKLDERIGGRGGATVGELYHSQDGKRGSLLRECGYPEWQLVGLACDGWAGVMTVEDYGVFHVRRPDHFLFQRPEVVELKAGDTFGHAPGGGLPRAIGHEWDVRLPVLVSRTKSVPEGGELPTEEPADIVTLADGLRPGGGTLDYFTQPDQDANSLAGQLIYWERPQGGRVLHFGTIAAGWALSADPKMQALMRNVLHHFGV